MLEVQVFTARPPARLGAPSHEKPWRRPLSIIARFRREGVGVKGAAEERSWIPSLSSNSSFHSLASLSPIIPITIKLKPTADSVSKDRRGRREVRYEDEVIRTFREKARAPNSMALTPCPAPQTAPTLILLYHLCPIILGSRLTRWSGPLTACNEPANNPDVRIDIDGIRGSMVVGSVLWRVVGLWGIMEGGRGGFRIVGWDSG
mmetsp:Transcript_13445/g.27439  ORF Transcript_13445/g.27439 Transcript_13445/m.27439 type:complete len:204 (+) Transcript_13445:160-771(+)